MTSTRDMLKQLGGTTWAALDFETAASARDSACEVAVVRVEDAAIVQRWKSLIRPATRRFTNTHVHGIRRSDVAEAPDFAQLWPALERQLCDVQVVVAWRASFDRAVMLSCCGRAGIVAPRVHWLCAAEMAGQFLSMRHHRLTDVARDLGFAHTPHDALSDAEVCVRVTLECVRAAR